jgi:hypothetical protein
LTDSDVSEKKTITVVSKTIEEYDGTTTYTIGGDNGKYYQEEVIDTNIRYASAPPARKTFILNADIGDEIDENVLEEK